MNVFIGWSGDRSKAIAAALRDWIPMVLQHVKPWMSETDISPGERWSPAVAKQLDETDFGLICLTPENLTAPWLLFEAGALAKSVEDGRVIPLLLELDASDISLPLGQFQAKKLERDGICDAMKSINKSSGTIVAESTLDTCLEELWSILEPKLNLIRAEGPSGHQKKTRSDGEILEELVGLVRSTRSHVRILDATLERSIGPQSYRENWLKRFAPKQAALEKAAAAKQFPIGAPTTRLMTRDRIEQDSEPFTTDEG